MIINHEHAAAWLLLQTRLAATKKLIATLPMPTDRTTARKRRVKLVTTRRRAAYFTGVFYL